MDTAKLDILIADDHEPMRMVLERVFAKAGAGSVRSTASGAEALAALRERPATLVIADQNMPGMDGLSLVRAIRADASVYGTPHIVMLSGDAGAEHEAAARLAGADAVLAKPLSTRDILAAIEGLFAV